MTIEQEMTATLFLPDTIDKVKKQFKNGPDKVPLEAYDISFRLFKPTNFNINLEVLTNMQIGNTDEEIDLKPLGKVKMQKVASFLKPIGFYTLSGSDVEVSILNEYEKNLDFLIHNNKISAIKVNKLSLQQNALIGAFSKEARIKAYNYKDCSFTINGLQFDIFMTFQGYPQVFLDDKYGIPGPIAAYFLRGNNQSINPVTEYKELFDTFDKMSLLTSHGKDIGS